MKLTAWNILTIIFLIGTIALAAVFTVVFAMPNVLPLNMRPVIVPQEIVLPTATETPFVFPATWTKSPIAASATPTVPTNTATLEPTDVPPTSSVSGTAATVQGTAVGSSTNTITPTKTLTLKVNVVVTAKTATLNKTPTKTPKNTATKTPTKTLTGGIPYFLAVDDIATVAPNPSSVVINVLGNDYNNTGETLRIAKILTYPKHGSMSVDLAAKIIYKGDPGYTGTDTIVYRMTVNSGYWSDATVHINVMEADMHIPDDISPNVLDVPENLAAGTVIAGGSTPLNPILTAHDDDVGDTFKFKLVSGDGDDNNNMVRLDTNGIMRSTAMYDREIKPQLKIRVRVTDSTGLFYEEKLLINVGNVNEPPEITTGEPPDGRVGSAYSFIVRTSDPDTTTRPISLIAGSLPDSLTLTDNNNGTATISGVPSVPGTFVFTIQVDDGEFTDEESYSVTIAVAPTATASNTPTSTFTPSPTT